MDDAGWDAMIGLSKRRFLVFAWGYYDEGYDLKGSLWGAYPTISEAEEAWEKADAYFHRAEIFDILLDIDLRRNKS